ncbi:MAG: hypothetical protein DMD96_16885 [Candidatus Rokuibacteriota bacterium]|nr:MAG: hypothetical protein DMD96_16885 [Candidatus Rokubacteria bacterium]
MRSTLALCALLAALSGCSTASLPYKPEFPPSGRTISADYLVLADRLRVEIDTGGYRLENAQIVMADRSVRPQTIEHPPAGSGSSTGIGIGVGGASIGSRGGVGVGTGVGVNIPMGGDTRVQGNTVLYFALDQVGAAPWRLSVKVAETDLTMIVLPPR